MVKRGVWLCAVLMASASVKTGMCGVEGEARKVLARWWINLWFIATVGVAVRR